MQRPMSVDMRKHLLLAVSKMSFVVSAVVCWLLRGIKYESVFVCNEKRSIM